VTVAILVAVVAVVAWLALEVRELRLVLEQVGASLEQRPPAGAIASEGAVCGEDVDHVCTHQPEHRTDTSTSGVWRWRCDPKKGGCGFVFERPASTGDYR